MRKLLFVFGTRPEAIKLAPVILAARSQRQRFVVRICLTGQHREMINPILRGFGIAPDVDLGLMTPNQTLGQLTASLMTSLDVVIREEQPDVVLVQGDTTSVFVASLAAFYYKVPVAHIEAGLRTHNRYSPWPEEVNRNLVSRIAAWHFAPTAGNRSNLMSEGIEERSIFVTGNTVIDALFLALRKIKQTPALVQHLDARVRDLIGLGQSFVLITGHRRENFGEGFENICHAILELAVGFPSVTFVYPVHLNPSVQGPVNRILGSQPNVLLLSPLDYFGFVHVMAHTVLILTDSGGVQEEAPSLGKPVLVMRENTERPEALRSGLVHLVGTDRYQIVTRASAILSQPAPEVLSTSNPYGDGRASERILNILADAESD